VNVKRALLMSGACGILATAVSTALAQESNEVAEVVIVTGSYIRGAAEDTALPIDVISSEDLEKVGSPTTLDLIKSLTISNGVLGDTNQFDARAQGNEGAGSINLRGLGRERTLVLLNGRRMVKNPFTDAVDTNLIPTAAIGRIEVLKDGAAATYGSDAIAGVVNFITKDTLRGLEIGGDFKHIDGSDGDYTASLAWGWRTDRMHALISGGYQHRSELKVLERDWAFPSFTDSPQGGWSGGGNPSGFALLSTLVPQSQTNPLGSSGTLRDPNCAALGGVPTGGTQTSAGPPATFSFPTCSWQFTPYDNLTEKEDRYQIFGNIDVDIGESTAFHVEGLYAKTEVPDYKTSPSYLVLQSPVATPGVYLVPFANPGVQDFIANNPVITTVQGTTAPSALLMDRGIALAAATFRPFALGGNPAFGYGPSNGEREYEGWRLSAGLNGDFSDNLSWDVAVTYMEEEALRTGRDTLVNRLQAALAGFGGPNCTGTDPGENGCMWFNPFSSAVARNGITGAPNPTFDSVVGDNTNPELINWFFYNGFTRTTNDIIVVDAVLTGQTGWQLGGGNVAWAFGAQYRETSRKNEVDDFTNLDITPCPSAVTGGAAACAGRPATGPYVFLGGAFEYDVSQDVYATFGELRLPWAENFEMQLAARYEDYGGRVGSTFDPKLSLRWQLFDALALRGSVGTTFRGPPEEQIAPGSITSLQNIAGSFRAVDIFNNPDLEPESATTFNVGMLVRAGGFSGSLDYWNFDFDNPIVVEPVGGIVSALFPTGLPARCGDPALAGVEARFTFAGGVCNTTNIQRVRVNRVNGAPVKTDGLDLSLQYDFDNVLGGGLTLGANATYILGYDVDATVVGGVTVAPAFEAVGFLNYQTTAIPLPELKGNAFIQYSIGAHNIRWTTNYIDGYTDQRVLAPNPTLGKHIDSFVTHDLNYRVELPWEMRLVASVENITDEEPPFVRLELAYDPFTANAFGRIYKLGLTKRFGAE
jgi:iron complex outermembrane receptor protein